MRGLQVPVTMRERDERTFLDFLRSTAPIQLLVTPAPTQADAFLGAFPPRTSGQMQFYIWNQDFPWAPDFAPTTAGSTYVRHIDRGPVFSYCRDPFSAFDGNASGRLHWARMLAPDGAYDYKGYPFAYDAHRYEAWFKRVTAWAGEHAAPSTGNSIVRYLTRSTVLRRWVTR